MTFGSLFSGIGGIDIGLEQAGMECRWQCEIEPYAVRVLEKHWPDVSRFQDIRECYGTVFLDRSVRTCYPELGWDKRMSGKLIKMTPAGLVEATRLYNSGLSVQQVANFYCISRQAMWDHLRKTAKMRSNLHFGKDNHFNRGGPRACDRAQNLCEEAVKRGILKRKAVCEKCGATPVFSDGRSGIHAHHRDYNKPLDVMWLCQQCHHEWHKNNRAIPLEVRRELPPVSVLCGGFP